MLSIVNGGEHQQQQQGNVDTIEPPLPECSHECASITHLYSCHMHTLVCTHSYATQNAIHSTRIQHQRVKRERGRRERQHPIDSLHGVDSIEIVASPEQPSITAETLGSNGASALYSFVCRQLKATIRKGIKGQSRINIASSCTSIVFMCKRRRTERKIGKERDSTIAKGGRGSSVLYANDICI